MTNGDSSLRQHRGDTITSSRNTRLHTLITRLQILLLGILLGALPGLYVGIPSSTDIADTQQTHPELDCDHNHALQLDTASSSSSAGSQQEQESTVKTKHPDWCPTAQCTDTDLCHPCQRRFLIVIATPRSASTTLTWMLDELPGIRMAGENNNMLTFIFNANKAVFNHSSFHRGNEERTSWGHNHIPNQTFACAAQAMIQAINPPELLLTTDRIHLADKLQEQSTIVGFKTIRFERGVDGKPQTEQEWLEKVEFVKENFPCSRILVNINSNVTRQSESFKAAKWGTISENSLRNRMLKLKRIAELFGPERAYLLDSAEWTKNVEILNAAVSWLGFDRACHFRELLQFNTAGAKGFTHSKTKLDYHSPRCKRLE
ncbi:expressed unknown protein [Seminavis robusta]|uniref:Sulfotransferase n=1 Tax=Seminavis robusta TaxID=568900 RepID=A0A9N8H3V4_9STRA|nr:expressed unknown protein [Seminavis robusta]|eukprot:Sro70_g038850.1 n/a (374) ;mRNA; f:49651-50772